MTETIDVSAVADAIANVVSGGPGMGPPPPALPVGWVVKASRSNPGCYYYYHIIMGISSWQAPVIEQKQQEQDEETPKELISSLSYPNNEDAQQEPDPEDAPDRSSKRHKNPSSSSSESDGPKEVRALHILKKHKDSRRPSSWRQAKITSTKEEAKEELLGLLEILQEEEANPKEMQATFEELARTESDCSSAKRGGDLGFFGRRKMQPPFEHASFALEIGEMTKEVVETSSGVHLILRIG